MTTDASTGLFHVLPLWLLTAHLAIAAARTSVRAERSGRLRDLPDGEELTDGIVLAAASTSLVLSAVAFPDALADAALIVIASAGIVIACSSLLLHRRDARGRRNDVVRKAMSS